MGMKVVTVDTNVFGALYNKNNENRFSKFFNLINSQVGLEYLVCNTHFSIYEKIGINVPKLNLSLPLKLPTTKPNEQLFEMIGQQACDLLAYLKHESRVHYSKYISAEIIKQRLEEQKSNYWRNDVEAQKYFSHFLPNIREYESYANDFIDLLSTDFQHGYVHIPMELEGRITLLMILSLYVEYKGEAGIPRNMVLGRIFKRMWLGRIQSGDKVSKESVDKFHSAMKFKNSEDFVDLELVYMSLVGFYMNGKYNQTYFITQDPAEKIKRRIFVVREILNAINNDVLPYVAANAKFEFNYGVVIVVDKNLDIVEIINPIQLLAKDFL
jgi:hypothetical protein